MADAPSTEAVKPLQSPGRNDWIFALALLVVTLAVYYPAWFGKPIWDDDAHITSPALQSWTGLAKIWTHEGATTQYYPLSYTVFWVEYRLWGNDTTGYHLTRILLHVFLALLLLKLLRRLEIPGALLATAIFTLHPMEVESVAWISELKNLLSGIFYISSILIYLRFDRNREWRLYWIALGLFITGMLCKTVIATLPAALLVIFWWKRGKLSWKRDAAPLIPFFAAGLGLGLLTAGMEAKYVIGSEISSFRFTPVERFLIAGRAFWFYPGKLLWPAKLIFIYPRWNVSQGVWWQYLFPVAALLLVAVLWMLRKRTRAPLAAVLFFGGTLFPALGFVNVYPFIYSFVADHFQYLAGIGIITLASAGAALLAERLRGWQRTAGHLFAAAILMLLAALSWSQCHMYADARALYTTTIEQNPGCWMAYNNLGNDFLSKGQVDEAIGYFRKALEIKPDFAKPENNLGVIFYQKGMIPEAISHFQKALELRPDLPEAHNDLANILFKEGHVNEAIAHYQMALKTQPDYAAALTGLGNGYYAKGDMDDALTEYLQALEAEPDIPEIQNNTANVLLQKGRVIDAISHYQKALEINPDYLNPLNVLAWLMSTGDSSIRNGTKAVELATKANQLSGGENAGILGTLAAAYAEVGRFPEAVDAAGHALRLATAANNSGMINALNAQLRFYQAGRPFHQTSR